MSSVRKPFGRGSLFVTPLVVAYGATLFSTAALASLKDKPPKGVELAGMWQLDPYRSDDPNAVIDQAQSEMRDRGSGSGDGGRGRMHHGGWGGGGGGGGFPGGGGGGWGGRHGGMGGSRGSSGGGSSSGSPQAPQQLLADVAANPNRLAFSMSEHTLKVTADDANTECAAGVKVAISDANGDAERNCGWDGRAWVIETARGKNFTRTDRYEFSKDGKTLTYVTTATGARMSKVKISRVYTLQKIE